MNLVSVIIPFYKKHQFLKRAIESVLNQTYQKFEIIIIHDDPEDNNFELIEEIKKKDQRILISRNKENIGAGLSRNVGIDMSSGKYIAFLDADDIWYKDKLSNQIKFMEKNNFEFSHTSYEIIDLFEKKISNRIAPPKLDYNQLVKSCDIGLSSVILEKRILKNFRFPSLKTKEDFVLWLLLARSGIRIYSLPQILMKWRKTRNSLSDNVYQKISDGYKVYKYHLNFNFLLSLKCLFVLSVNFLFKKIFS